MMAASMITIYFHSSEDCLYLCILYLLCKNEFLHNNILIFAILVHRFCAFVPFLVGGHDKSISSSIWKLTFLFFLDLGLSGDLWIAC